MPTISQLPPANAVQASDEVPISQSGVARSVAVGELLASVQPSISLSSPSLLGRTSIGAGVPEQVNLGVGVSLSDGTLVADGLDHSGFGMSTGLSPRSDLVISNQGVPMLMKTSLLRGLFTAGENVVIDPNGTISAGAIGVADHIGSLNTVAELSSGDLVAVSQSGTNCAITYSNLLDGITIDQAQIAGPLQDSDSTWVAQGGDILARQTFAAIWTWIAGNLPSYKIPVVEIDVNTNLDAVAHNGRLLICSRSVTLMPTIPHMGSGFQCTLVNASTGTVTLGSGFISSNGSLSLAPWQSAILCCAAYSGGTIAFALMSAAAAAGTSMAG